MMSSTTDHLNLDLSTIKRRVQAMLLERADVASPESDPSAYWSGFASVFAYMMDLSEDSFRKLRHHTYHLTGDNYQTYMLGLGPERWRQNQGFDTMYRELPDYLHIQEPEPGIGYRFGDGRYLSSDVARFQRVVRTLYREGILAELKLRQEQGERPRILEIGGGYGGLAYHVRRIIPDAVYVILDLPETLLFSAAYLSQHATESKIHLYSPNDDLKQMLEGPNEPDFLLMPNHRLDGIRGVTFDLVINVESLQEMTQNQVMHYLEFIRAHCTGRFYSWNQDRNPSNQELDSLHALIDMDFHRNEIQPPSAHPRARLESFLRGLARRIGLMDVSTYTGDMRTRENILLPKRPEGP